MSKIQYKTSYNKGKYNINISISIYNWQEKGIFYIYSPALDITGYGNNVKEAKKSFEHTLIEFVSYTDNKKTIFDELEHLGWTVNRKKKRVHAPDLEDLLDDNDSLKEIITKTGVNRVKQNIELALS